MLPGANGGSEWSPPAVNPKLGYMYVLGLEQPMNYITHSAPIREGEAVARLCVQGRAR